MMKTVWELLKNEASVGSMSLTAVNRAKTLTLSSPAMSSSLPAARGGIRNSVRWRDSASQAVK